MEKERLEKVRRIIFLETELFTLSRNCARPDVVRDFSFLRAEDEVELTKLYFELYPEPPKDLFEDVKKRIKKYKKAKADPDIWAGLSFIERIKSFFGIK